MTHLRVIAGLVLGVATADLAVAASGSASSAEAAPALSEIASEARQTIAVIDWFYVRHRACPQPSRQDELLELQSGLGDGFTLDREGDFVAIHGISMSSVWLYYTTLSHPDRCTLLRQPASPPVLIWRRHGGGGRWAIADESGERPLKLTP